MTEQDERMRHFDELCRDSAVRNRSFYPDFRRGWESLLRGAAESDELYFDPGGENQAFDDMDNIAVPDLR